MTAQTWSALIAAAALIVMIGFQIAGWRRDRFSRGVDAVRSMDVRWESTEFREQRRRAATFLISKDASDDFGKEALYGVLNFFETLGFFYSKKITDAETLWHFFGTWVLPYYAAAQAFIETEHKQDPNVYSELKSLFDALCKVERKKHPSKSTEHMTSESQVLGFLKTEETLTLTPRPSSTPL